MSEATTDPIVVGVALRDDDEAPLALGRDLARFMGAPLALVHVYPYEPAPRMPSAAYDTALREQSLQRLEDIAGPLRAGLDVTVHAEGSRSAARGLHDAAEALDAALLVVGSSHRGTLRRVLPGGVGERLLHGAPCAVTLAPRGYPGAERGYRRIGVAFLDTADGREALATAVTFAMLSGAELTAFTVIEPPRFGPGAAAPGWVPPAGYDAGPRIRETEERVREWLPSELGAEITVVEGEPAGLLAELSARVDLLICGSRGYGPLRTVLLGGVSGRLAHTAACPLLVIPRSADRASAGARRGRTPAARRTGTD
jgi:nucleotide-binding universal stress UspA family protein